MTYVSTNNWDHSVDSYYVMGKSSGQSSSFQEESVAGVETYGTGESAVPSSYDFGEPAVHVPEFPNRVCFDMLTNGCCKWGNNCRYAHAEPAVHKPEFPSKVCKAWEAGNCERGNFCKYAHPRAVAQFPRKGGVGHVGKLSKRQKMRAAAAQKTNLRPTAKVAIKKPASLVKLQAYVSKCLKDNKFLALPKEISVGLGYYNLPFPNAKFYPQQPYENLLAEINLRVAEKRRSRRTLLAVPNYDAMSTMSSASSSSWKSVPVAPSVIQEDLFNKKCKGGKGEKATWSENGSDLSSVACSTMSYNPADLKATGVQMMPRPETKAPTPVAVKRLVVVCEAGVPIYNGPNGQKKIGDAKYLSAHTFKRRAGPWVETDQGWMLERHASGGLALVPAQPKDVLCVKLAAGQFLSVRTQPSSESQIVGKLVNGNVIVAGGRHGNWVKHADGWSLCRNRTAVFIVEVNSRPVRKPQAKFNGAKVTGHTFRNLVNGSTLKERAAPVCFTWLENRGQCTKPDCMYSHEYPKKEMDRNGQPKLCRAHEKHICKYGRWPRACRFTHMHVNVNTDRVTPVVKPTMHCPTCDTQVLVNDWEHHVKGKKHKNKLYMNKLLLAQKKNKVSTLKI